MLLLLLLLLLVEGGEGEVDWNPRPRWDGCSQSHGSCLRLQNCCLNDDTLLEGVSWAEPHQVQLPHLQAEEQAVILGVW